MGNGRRGSWILLPCAAALVAVVFVLLHGRSGDGGWGAGGWPMSPAEQARDRVAPDDRTDVVAPRVGRSVTQARHDAAPSRAATSQTNEEALAQFMQELMGPTGVDGDSSMRQLVETMRSEEPDPAWTTEVERMMDAAVRISREDADDAAEIGLVECGHTLCVVQAVGSRAAADTVADWPGLVNSLAEAVPPPFVTTRTNAKVLPDGRILYVTALVR